MVNLASCEGGILWVVWLVDEEFQNVLSEICSAKHGYYGVLKDLSAVQSVMISFTSG